MCCPACQAVAGAIVAGGLDNYYRFRTQAAARPESPSDPASLHHAWSDDPAVLATFSTLHENGEREVRLAVEGIHCAACCWLIEHALGKMPGVIRIQVNLGSHRALMRWDPQKTTLATLLERLERVGYRANPLRHDLSREARLQGQRQDLLRLGVAAMVMMQAGMFSYALYYSDFSYMAQDHKRTLQIFGFLMTLPVMFYSAVPFFRSAWQSLAAKRPGMDVSVSLALWVAFIASLHATVTGTGHVYFDSISMFVCLLLLARYAEASARQHFFSAEVAALLPIRCQSARETETRFREKGLQEVAVGDRVRVASGEVIPFDGQVLEGSSHVNESAFSGESLPVQKQGGDQVFAGSINGENPLLLRVEKNAGQGRIDVITHLAELGEARKPPLAQVADRIAAHFTVLVLSIALAAALYWWQRDVTQVLPVIIAVLVVSCPCALSLAIPSALSFCYQSLRYHGLWVLNGELPDRMAAIRTVVFDKTGTLTEGQFECREVRLSPEARALGYDEKNLLEIAACLEQGSAHPLASAFRHVATDLAVRELRTSSGCGIEGVVSDRHYRLGARLWCESLAGQPWSAVLPLAEPAEQQIFLATETAMLACFVLQDQCRSDAAATIAQLRQGGLRVILLSGDSSGAAERLAKQLGINECHSAQSPEQKLEFVSGLQAQGQAVMMVGDGINDIPVLAQADVSVAMNRASDLAKLRADAILLRDQLGLLPALFSHCRRTRAIIRQNLFWALLYNGLALPAAASGYVSPWLAAIGMSLSSLLVTANSIRLRKIN